VAYSGGLPRLPRGDSIQLHWEAARESMKSLSPGAFAETGRDLESHMQKDNVWPRIALGLWGLILLVIPVWVYLHPLERSVTEIYHATVNQWWSQKPIYTGSSGFNYLPIFVPVFALFAKLPVVLCETLWRWTALAGLFLGLLACTRKVAASKDSRAFLIVSLLSLPICLSALRNGQSSAHLAACLVLATYFLGQEQWGRATFFLCLSLVCKPLGIPAIGLAALAFPGIWWRAAFGVLAVLAIPYLLDSVDYVNELYREFFRNIVDCFQPATDRTFADIAGLLAPFGVKLGGISSLILRVGAGVVFALGAWATRAIDDRAERALIWLALTGGYIMLFTPMNEGNSYVMLAPAFGLWAWRFVEKGQLRAARAIALMAALFVFLPDIVGMSLGKDYGSEFGKFLYPLLTVIFLGLVASAIRLGRRPSIIANDFKG
jgi:hypothetical protein